MSYHTLKTKYEESFDGSVAQEVSRSPSTAVLEPRVRISVTPYGFRNERIGIWVGSSRSFSSFHLPQISFHHVSTYSSRSFSLISFNFFQSGDGASILIGKASLLFTDFQILYGASSYQIPMSVTELKRVAFNFLIFILRFLFQPVIL